MSCPVPIKMPKWLSIAHYICVPFRRVLRKKEYLVTCFGAYGDGLMITPILAEILTAIPANQVTVACSIKVLEIITRAFPGLNAVCFDGSSNKGRISRFIKGIKILSRRYSRSINANYKAIAFSHCLHMAAHAERRYWFRKGQASDRQELIADSQNIYTDLAESETGDHVLLKNKMLLKSLPFKTTQSCDRLPLLYLYPSEREQANEYMRSLRIKNLRIACICHGSRFKLKDWGWQNYACLILELQKRYNDMLCILLGGMEDTDNATMIMDRLRGKEDKVINLTGTTGIFQASAYIGEADLCIGNDTFGLHAAVALDVASVVVMWGGDYGEWSPWRDPMRHKMASHELDCYGCAGSCKYDEPKCISSISVEEVLSVAAGLDLTRKEGAADYAGSISQ